MNLPWLCAKRFKYTGVAVLLAALAASSIYWVKAKQTDSQAENDRFTKVVIGDLGGLKVNIPIYHAQLLEYEGDPGWEGKKKDAKPERTYQSRIASFGTQVRYPDMAGLSNAVLLEDKCKQKDEATNWISLTILSGPNYPGDGFLDRLASSVIDGVRADWADDFKRQNEKQFGLDLYVLEGIAPSGDMPAREVPASGADRYLHQDKNGRVTTYIKCQNSKYPAVRCQQSFSMEDDGFDIEVRIFYRRTMLKHWQDMQEKARQLILGWRAGGIYFSKPESGQATHQ